jgi:tetratricopeptide (TPR) repeat protein
MKKKLLALFFVLLMAAVGVLQYKYDSQRGYLSARQVFVTLPPGKTLKILSFGFRDLVADMLFIWSIQFYSSYHLTNSYQYIEHVFNTITDINPRYKEPYIVGSWIMALEVGDIPMAMRLLQKGSANMPDEWIFDYECGFYAYKNLKDYTLAEKFFSRAMSKPGVPAFIKRTRAHMAYMEDNLQYAYQLWMDIYKKAKDQLELDVARNHLGQIKFEMDKKYLDQQINLFKQKYKRFPSELAELKKTGLVKEIPMDFFGGNYIYDPGEGTITTKKVKRWKKSF